MANEKNLKRLKAEDKKLVAGGDIYAGPDKDKIMVYYVPHPNPRTRKSLAYKNLEDAKAEARRLSQDDVIHTYFSADAAKKASDEELGRLMRGSSQKTIEDFFKKK